MPVLRPITDSEYSAWLAEVVPAYAADKIASGAWVEAGALERSLKEYEALLPEGRSTPDHHIHSILDAAGSAVGTLWFAVQERGTERVAYVYNVSVRAQHRRQGHALRAFAALESEVRRLGLAGIALHVFGHNRSARALYEKLGYVPTNLNLYKPLAAGVGGGPGDTP
jgi:ribosomal protein S18 acetylase RimI-like enzyme